MKKLLLIAALFLLTLPSFAQDAPVETPKFAYCEIVGTSKLFSTKVNISIDFGQRTKFFSDNRMRDPETGEVMEFNSMIDALNFMGRQGWEFTQAYAVTSGNQNVYHYLLQMPFEKLDAEEQRLFVKGN